VTGKSTKVPSTFEPNTTAIPLEKTPLAPDSVVQLTGGNETSTSFLPPFHISLPAPVKTTKEDNLPSEVQGILPSNDKTPPPNVSTAPLNDSRPPPNNSRPPPNDSRPPPNDSRPPAVQGMLHPNDNSLFFHILLPSPVKTRKEEITNQTQEGADSASFPLLPKEELAEGTSYFAFMR